MTGGQTAMYVDYGVGLRTDVFSREVQRRKGRQQIPRTCLTSNLSTSFIYIGMQMRIV